MNNIEDLNDELGYLRVSARKGELSDGQAEHVSRLQRQREKLAHEAAELRAATRAELEERVRKNPGRFTTHPGIAPPSTRRSQRWTRCSEG